MDAHASLEVRVARLESSLKRTRRVAAGLALLLTVVASAAFARDDGEIRTGKLVLLETDGRPGVTLVAGPGSSLVIQNAAGEEVLRLGGHPARRIPGRRD